MSPRIALAGIGRLGRDLTRCEGVMVTRDGTVWAADGRGACTRIAPDGSREERVGQLGGEPNGICFDAAGWLIVANMAGSVQRLDPEAAATRCSRPRRPAGPHRRPTSPSPTAAGGSGSRTARRART